MAEPEFTWHGDRVEAEITAASMDGIELAAEHLLQVSSDLAPHEEGTLARSGTVTVDREAEKAAVSYHTVYARRQHEELTWKHDPGKIAKYLEQPMNTERQVMLAIVAAVGGAVLE